MHTTQKAPRLYRFLALALLGVSVIFVVYAVKDSRWADAGGEITLSLLGTTPTTTINATMDDVLNNGLVGYWSMDGNDIDWGTQQIVDRSGYYATGTISNIATTSRVVVGKRGQALDFNGTNALITTSNITATDNLGALTVSAWIYPRSIGEGSRGRIVDKADATTPTNGWLFVLTNNAGANQLGFIVDYAGTNLSYDVAANSITLDQWQHVVVTWNGNANPASNNVRISVNGSSVSSVTATAGTSGRVDDATQVVKIGNDKSLARTFDGYIDDVRIYNRVLSDNEIDLLYQSESTINYQNEFTNLVDPSSGSGVFNFSGRRMDWKTGRLYDADNYFSTYVQNMSTDTTPTAGKVGQAFFFDGEDDLLLSDYPGSLLSDGFPNELATRTLAVWVKPQSGGGQNKGVLIDYTDNISGWKLILCDDGVTCDNAFRFTQSFSGATGTWQTATGTIVYDEWQHLTLAYDESLATNEPTFYINSVVSPTITVIPALGVRTGDGTTQRLRIGNSSTTDQGFHGVMDEFVAYYPSIMPQETVTKLYNLSK